MSQLYLLSDKEEQLPAEIPFEFNGEKYTIKTAQERVKVTFTDVEEETNDYIKIWMHSVVHSAIHSAVHSASEDKLIRVAKPLPDWLIISPCEAKYFEGENTKIL